MILIKKNYGRTGLSIDMKYIYLPHKYGPIKIREDTPTTEDGSRIDFGAWISRISDKWPGKNIPVKRDLTKIL